MCCPSPCCFPVLLVSLPLYTTPAVLFPCPSSRFPIPVPPLVMCSPPSCLLTVPCSSLLLPCLLSPPIHLSRGSQWWCGSDDMCHAQLLTAVCSCVRFHSQQCLVSLMVIVSVLGIVCSAQGLILPDGIYFIISQQGLVVRARTVTD